MPQTTLLDLWESNKRSDPQLTVDRFIDEQASDLAPAEIALFRAAAEKLAVIDQKLFGGDLANQAPDATSDLKADPGGLGLKAGTEPLPGYTLVRPLGRGGFGEVWEANAPGGVPVALKFVGLDDQGTSVEQRSLEVMKNVRHAHLLAISGSWQIDTHLILAYELADGTLLDRFDQATKSGHRGIPRDELFAYMAEAAKGLDYLNHPDASGRQGIQHRDIKPQNIFLSGGSVKVGDFGLVRSVQNAATKHTGSHTWAYAPPEFIEEQTVSQHSDQYSLAVTYCYLRGGKLPYDGSILNIVLGHVSKEPDLSMIPTKERPVVKRALAKDPEDRWDTCGEFARNLRKSANHPDAEEPLHDPARTPTFREPEQPDDPSRYPPTKTPDEPETSHPSAGDTDNPALDPTAEAEQLMRRIRIEVNKRSYHTALPLAERYLELNPTSRQIGQLVVQLRSRLPAPPAAPPPVPTVPLAKPAADVASTARPHVADTPATPDDRPVAPAPSPKKNEDPSASAMKPAEETIPPPVIVNPARQSPSSADNHRSDDTGGFTILPGSQETPAPDSSGSQQPRSPVLSSLSRLPRKYLLWGIPLLSLLIVGIVVVAFRDKIVENLPIPGGDLFASYDRGYGDTILSYTNRSYEDAEWEEMEELAAVISQERYPELRMVTGWTDKSYWIASDAAIYHHYNDKFTRTYKCPDYDEVEGMRAFGEHDLMCAHGGSNGAITRISKGGESTTLERDGPRFSVDECRFTIVNPDDVFVHSNYRYNRFFVRCDNSSCTSRIAEDESDNKITLTNANKTPLPGYDVNAITATQTPKKDQAYGISYHETGNSHPPLLVRFDGTAWRKVINIKSPNNHHTSRPKATWLLSKGSAPTAMVTVGQGNNYSDSLGTVYEHDLEDGQYKQHTVTDPPGDATSKELIAVWGMNLDKYWVMDNSGTVWERREKTWRAVVLGNKSKGITFIDAWVSPTGTVIAITEDAVWRLK